MRGKETTTDAITAAYHVNTKGCPNNHSIDLPTQLLRPKITNKIKPTTVGGSTKGNIKTVSITVLPLNEALDINLAMNTAAIKTTILAMSETFRDKRMGVTKSFQSRFKEIIC
jgi:hypothetical protein